MSINYSECIKRLYPTIIEHIDFMLYQDETGINLLWNNIASFGPKPTFETLEEQWLPVVKAQALGDIKEIRRQGLDKAAISSGILAIYDENYHAAKAFLDGDPTRSMKNGVTAEVYLTGFGANIGMTATQFATYIISENQRVGPTVYQIEKRYLALTYAGDSQAGIAPINSLATVADITNTVTNFKTFCGL